ncbi:hypothetical protein BCR33DRAFT_737947 [Rhizoclosmatium globosum]|uniref:Uncharacterized protein n=1 Tax=Rhizoclosmatium globosum TaxID=329046 RepID=A0A1Y2CBP8_9FUNG|nr:hypothetical protein BCR33DRAFT_737947 [Rhizoclosmatium globosum]|eukprot:ORY44317.1 hypothetical protein BCR33DRAFT_737947 [Rhizoclosmatium globosum]
MEPYNPHDDDPSDSNVPALPSLRNESTVPSSGADGTKMQSNSSTKDSFPRLPNNPNTSSTATLNRFPTKSPSSKESLAPSIQQQSATPGFGVVGLARRITTTVAQKDSNESLAPALDRKYTHGQSSAMPRKVQGVMGSKESLAPALDRKYTQGTGGSTMLVKRASRMGSKESLAPINLPQQTQQQQQHQNIRSSRDSITAPPIQQPQPFNRGSSKSIKSTSKESLAPIPNQQLPTQSYARARSAGPKHPLPHLPPSTSTTSTIRAKSASASRTSLLSTRKLNSSTNTIGTISETPVQEVGPVRVVSVREVLEVLESGGRGEVLSRWDASGGGGWRCGGEGKDVWTNGGCFGRAEVVAAYVDDEIQGGRTEWYERDIGQLGAAAMGSCLGAAMYVEQDRAYGMLGLLPYQSEIVADYKENLETVWKRLCAEAAEKAGDLSVFLTRQSAFQEDQSVCLGVSEEPEIAYGLDLKYATKRFTHVNNQWSIKKTILGSIVDVQQLPPQDTRSVTNHESALTFLTTSFPQLVEKQSPKLPGKLEWLCACLFVGNRVRETMLPSYRLKFSRQETPIPSQ